MVESLDSCRRVGLLAGWGRYPFVVAEALQRKGLEVHCLAVRNEADPELANVCASFRYYGLGQFGRATRALRRRGITRATMAGKIHKVFMFRRGWILRNLPDWTTMRAFVHHFGTRRRDCNDDALLRTVVGTFAERGIALLPATDFVPEVLVKEGQLTRRAPSAGQRKDIAFGWKLAKELGRLDCGQSVACKNQAVLALEAVEGTDHCIRRAGEFCPGGGFTVVKTAKPRQDMRFDVPTVGLGTVKTLHESGGKVLAVEADRTIFLDEAEVIDYANRHNLIIVACHAEAM